MAVYRETRPESAAMIAAVAEFTGIPAGLIRADCTELAWQADGGMVRVVVEVPATLSQLSKLIKAGQRSKDVKLR